MGVRRSSVKNKKSKRGAAAVAVKRDEALRKAARRPMNRIRTELTG